MALSGDIGRVGDDYIESAGDSRRPISHREMRALAKPEPPGVIPRGPDRATRDVDRRSRSPAGTRIRAPKEGTRCRSPDRESDRRAARSASRASTASTMVSLSGLGSSVSGESTNSSPQNSRLPMIRLSGSCAVIRQSILRGSGLLRGGQNRFRMREDVVGRHFKRRSEQPASLPARLIEPRRRQRPRGPVEGSADRQGGGHAC